MEPTQSVLMYKAINAGDARLVKYLLLNGCSSDVLLQDSNRRTALIFATVKGNVTILQMLIQFRAALDFKDKHGMTALMYASVYNRGDILMALVHAGADGNAVDNEGKTALLHAAQAGSVDYIPNLIRLQNVDLNHVDAEGKSAVTLAACGGHESCLDFLIKHGADIDAVDNNGNSPLSSAIHLSKLNQAEILLSYGAKVVVKNKEGKSPLTKAFQLNRNDNIIQLIKRLLSCGAVPSHTSYDEYYIHEMIARGQSEIVQQMLINGCAPRLRVCKENIFDFNISEPISPLSVALLTNRLAIAKYLLSNVFLTSFDIKKLPKHPAIISHLTTQGFVHCSSLLNDISSFPFPLTILSLLSVSRDYYWSDNAQYKNYVLSSLPPSLQRKLFFQAETVSLCMHEWETIPLVMESGQVCPMTQSVFWPIGHRLQECQTCSVRKGYRVDKFLMG